MKNHLLFDEKELIKVLYLFHLLNLLKNVFNNLFIFFFIKFTYPRINSFFSSYYCSISPSWNMFNFWFFCLLTRNNDFFWFISFLLKKIILKMKNLWNPKINTISFVTITVWLWPHAIWDIFNPFRHEISLGLKNMLFCILFKKSYLYCELKSIPWPSAPSPPKPFKITKYRNTY